jgi:molybdopterin-containing oxidoreductase family iron-sulfur binding subunit
MRALDHDDLAGATGIDRREFLRLSTAVAAAGALASAGCQVPQEATVPYHDMPEDLVDGLGPARVFHTVLDGSPVQVKTREGRPVLVTPAGHRVSGRGLSVRHHASLMDLYDPDRAPGPASVRRGKGAVVASNWTTIGTDVVTRLKSSGAKAVLLTAPINSPSLRAAIEAVRAKTGMRHVEWSPLSSTAADESAARAFGAPVCVRPRLDRASLIVGLGAEFLDRPEDGYEADFAARRSPDPINGAGMSRFIQFESRLTVTGANADRRIRVRDSQLSHVGAALAHELIVIRKLGPLAGNPDVIRALTGRGIYDDGALSGIGATTLRSLANELANAMGRTVVVAGGSASVSAYGPAIETSSLLLNVTLGAIDAGLLDIHDTVSLAPAAPSVMTSILSEMQAGAIDLLLVAGANPVYDAPAAFKVAEAIAKVGFVVSLNDRIDETSQLADVLAPISHPFECWSDASLPEGVLAVQQPVIQPLHDTRGMLEVLVDWAAALGDAAAVAAVTAATSQPVPAAATGQRQSSTSLAWHYLRAQWAPRLGPPGSRQFDEAWNEVLRTGWWQGPRPAAAPRSFNVDALAAVTNMPLPVDTVELQLYAHGALGDGRSGNNGWLHELPDPITRLTWGGAVSVAPRVFDAMGLANGDLVEVDAGHGAIIAPAYRHAGMHQDVVAAPLGLGRSACGAIGNGVGLNGFVLRTAQGNQWLAAALPVSIRRVDGHLQLADAQGADVIDRAQRPLVPTTTLSAYEEDRAAGTEQVEGGPSAWPEHAYPNARWAMAIDLSKCTGCGKCVIGCQAENNIPIVGRHGIIDGRPMSWLRIDRYYDAPAKEGGWDAGVWDGPLEVVEEPQTLFEPMLCQHCENAPCETVCPFSATMHSEDGLNQQIYNRCVGTRYCGNNCPFKVRRFNYWELSKKQDSAFFRWLVPRIAANAELNTREPMQLKNNPEVTVRSRGVMEKCSFCVQRIRAARAEATRDGRSKDHFADGEVVPACMEACATGAITFGDRHAPGAKVAELATHPRAMKLLDSLGVKPSVSYLTKVRNDKA